MGRGDLQVLYGAFLSMVVMAALLLLALPLESAPYHRLLMRFGLRTRSGVRSTLALTNDSEFGLIVAAIAASAGWLSAEWLVVISLALAGSFVPAAPLNANSEKLYARCKVPLSRLGASTLMLADQPICLGEVDAVVLGMGRIGSGAHERLVTEQGLRVLGVGNNPDKLAVHQAAGRDVIEGDSVDFDFWDKLVVGGPLKLVLLAMPSHAGNLYPLQQLKHRAFAGHIAAIVQYRDEIAPLRALGG